MSEIDMPEIDGSSTAGHSKAVDSSPASRRQVLARTGALGAGIAFTGALSELFAGTAAAQELGHSGYGPLVPDPKGLLDLPKGFRYRVLSREGDPLRSGEGPVPSNHDGMAAFAGRHGRVHLVRNHENRATPRIPVPTVKGLTYDPMGKGGCTSLTLDRDGDVLSERVAIAGTAVNCAGGPTPWGTWLTCEETEDKAGTNGYTKDHGFIFEVDGADPHRTGAVPLTAMGRFQHEAIAVDPRNGIVYETEDAFLKPFGLFYRFLPKRPLGGVGSLRAGGRLQAMRVPGVPDLSSIQEPGATFDGVEWVDVPDPLAAQTPSASRTSARRASRTRRNWRAVTGAGGACTSCRRSPTRARVRRPPTSARSGATTPPRAASPSSSSSARTRTSNCPANPRTTSPSPRAAA